MVRPKGMKLFEYFESFNKNMPLCTCAAHFSLSEPEENH